jgi:hypothetical protein
MKFLAVQIVLFTKTVRLAQTLFLELININFNSGTVRAFEINQSKRKNGLYFKYGTVRAFDFFSRKTENFRQKKRYASR